MLSPIFIRGGGDLATGVAVRLLRVGLRVVITELPHPLAVRRTVSFAEAVYENEFTVEGFTSQCVRDLQDVSNTLSILDKRQVPVLVDPDCTSAELLEPAVIVDARMIKHATEPIRFKPQLYIGLGPGFAVAENCQAIIETRRGHTLGRVLWSGAANPDTGAPEGDPSRVLHAKCEGIFNAQATIANHVEKGQVIAVIGDDCPVTSPLSGILRGLIHPGVTITRGMKIGDVDPRDDPRLCSQVSDKALSIGGGVLEAILSRPGLRGLLWG